MRKQILYLLLAFSISAQAVNAQNPLIKHIYAADPSAHVWPNDTNTLWLYTSHDVPGTNHHLTMFDYHVFSTQDLVTWTDHGRVLSVDDVDWAISHAWAIDAVYRHGNYYLVYCMIEKATGMFRTGLATSDVPQGPFTDIGFIQGVEWGQDPCLFVDDDNTPYLFWGAGGHCSAVQLTDDLKSVVPGTKVDLTSQLFEVFEGPWVHRYNGKYYLSYPGLPKGQWPEEMYYAIADKPLGPYEYKGKYIAEFKGRAGTNHGSIIKYKGNWLAFHHSAWLSGGMSEVRNLMADYLFYNPDGTIRPIIPDSLGLLKGKSNNAIIMLEAENGKAAGGRLNGTETSNAFPGYSGNGFVSGFDVSHDYVEVLVQVANDMKANLKVRLAADSDFNGDVLVGVKTLAGWEGTAFEKTNGWEIIDLGVIDLKQGDNKIRINSKKNANLRVDWFKVEPVNAQNDSYKGVDEKTMSKLGWKVAIQCWTYNTLTLFEALDSIQSLGVHYAELLSYQQLSKDIPQKSGPGMDAATREKLKAKLKETGIMAIAIWVDPFPADEANLRKLFAWAKELEIETITTEPDPGNKVAMELTARLCKEYEIKIAVHNHPRKPNDDSYKFWDPDFALGVVKPYFPQIGMCTDVGHWYRSGLESLDCLKKVDGFINSVHFKDLNLTKQDVPLGTGVLNASELLAELKRQQFKGVLTLEYESWGSKQHAEIVQCVEFLNNTCKALVK